MELTQYSIVLVNLNPTIGSEIRKMRPCLVISPDEMNRYLRTVVVAPMTTTLTDYPTRVNIMFEGQEGGVALDEIRAIDQQRVIAVQGRASAKEIRLVKSVIREAYVE